MLPQNHRAAVLAAICACCMAATSCTRNDIRRNAVLDGFAASDVRLPIGGMRDYNPPEFQHETEQEAVAGGPTPSRAMGETEMMSGERAAAHVEEIRGLYRKYVRLEEESATVAERTRLRNRIANTLITLIKHYHEGTTDDLYEISSGIETVFDFMGITVGALGSITGGVLDKAAYNAVGASLHGFRNSLSKNILAEQTKFAIYQQMGAIRTREETKLREALKGAATNDDTYPLSEVMIDVYQYFQAGSMKEAVAELAKSAQEAKTKADDARDAVLQEIRQTEAASRGSLLADARAGATRAAELRVQARVANKPQVAGSAQQTEAALNDAVARLKASDRPMLIARSEVNTAKLAHDEASRAWTQLQGPALEQELEAARREIAAKQLALVNAEGDKAIARATAKVAAAQAKEASIKSGLELQQYKDARIAMSAAADELRNKQIALETLRTEREHIAAEIAAHLARLETLEVRP